eukprot:8372597-Pyramimonas_sp.AAC.1
MIWDMKMNWAPTAKLAGWSRQQTSQETATHCWKDPSRSPVPTNDPMAAGTRLGMTRRPSAGEYGASAIPSCRLLSNTCKFTPHSRTFTVSGPTRDTTGVDATGGFPGVSYPSP